MRKRILAINAAAEFEHHGYADYTGGRLEVIPLNMGVSQNMGYLFEVPIIGIMYYLGVYIGVPLFWETTTSCRSTLQ